MHNKLFQLLADNRGIGRFSAETNGDEATIYVYDVIVSEDYWGGVSAKKFVEELNKLDASTIHLRINSPGGDVFAARSMEQAIREHKSNIIAHIDGYAASAASYVALAADSVLINEGGFFMIHKAWTLAWGNADDLLKTAELLEKIDQSLVNTYVKETRQETDQIAQWMKDETWFSAQEAVDYGFADAISADGSASNQATWNLAAYAHAPSDYQPSPIEKEDQAGDVCLKAAFDHQKRRFQIDEKYAV